MEDIKIKALAKHLDCLRKEIKISSYDDFIFNYEKKEYLVVTDSEADEKWDEELNNYIENCIKPEIPEVYQNYFNTDQWKGDARIDGRGHSLARYSGDEDIITIDDIDFYIYRQN